MKNTERDKFLTEMMGKIYNPAISFHFDNRPWEMFGILWEFAIRQDWWECFIWNEGVNKGGEGYLIDVIMINPNIFADAVYNFLKEQSK